MTLPYNGPQHPAQRVADQLAIALDRFDRALTHLNDEPGDLIRLQHLQACAQEINRLNTQAVENDGMETAAKLGEAENRIAVALGYLSDETRDRITRLRLAQLALENNDG